MSEFLAIFAITLALVGTHDSGLTNLALAGVVMALLCVAEEIRKVGRRKP